jgi:hypothetical protein
MKLKISLLLNQFQDQKGQAITEYILMLSIILFIYSLIFMSLNRYGIGKKVKNQITSSFVAAYRYGHVKAKGPDDGGPEYHPIDPRNGNNNFRIFLNPH